MQRIDSSNRAINLFGIGKDGFAAGVAALGQLATKWSAAFANSAQEELAAIIELPGGTALDATNLHQIAGLISSGSLAAWADTGGVNAFVITPNPPITAYAARQRFRVKAANATTGACTANVSGKGALPIVDSEGNALPAAAIAGGAIFDIEVDGAGHFQLLAGRSNQNHAFGGVTSFAGGPQIGATGLYTMPVITPAIALGVFVHLDPTNALLSMENAGGSCLQMESSGGSSVPAMQMRTESTASPYVNYFYGATLVGGIQTTGTATQYLTTSDARRKNVKGPIADPIGLLQKLNPLTFTMKGDDTETLHYGFLAHEVQEHQPQAVSGEKDGEHDIGVLSIPEGAVVADSVPRAANLPSHLEWRETSPAGGDVQALGQVVAIASVQAFAGVPEPATVPPGHVWTKTGRVPVWQGIDHSHLVPLLTAALQAVADQAAALAGQVDAMTADIAALKGRSTPTKKAS